MFEFKLRGIPTKVNADFEDSIGIYGQHFWNQVSENKYEPSTFDAIQRNYKTKSTFVDVGAATGCMSIYAAQLGYKVIAIEPQDQVFEALQINIALNDQYRDLVTCLNALAAVGKSLNSELFTLGAEGPLKKMDEDVKTINLVNLISEIDTDSIVIKMDIEGVEFLLLENKKLLKIFKEKKVILFLSVHPGFTDPINSPHRISIYWWRIKAGFQSWKMFINLGNYGCVYDYQGSKKLSQLNFLYLLYKDVRDFEIKFK